MSSPASWGEWSRRFVEKIGRDNAPRRSRRRRPISVKKMGPAWVWECRIHGCTWFDAYASASSAADAGRSHLITAHGYADETAERP